MLVLSRKKGQELIIGDNIRIYVSRVSGNRVTLGIEAPAGVSIVRSELAAIINAFRDNDDEPDASGPLPVALPVLGDRPGDADASNADLPPVRRKK